MQTEHVEAMPGVIKRRLSRDPLERLRVHRAPIEQVSCAPWNRARRRKCERLAARCSEHADRAALSARTSGTTDAEGAVMKAIIKLIGFTAVVGALTAFATERAEPLVVGSIHGDIELVSFGVATLSADRGPPIAAVHVRETFANRSDDFPWTVDASLATLWFGHGAPVQPVFANSDVTTLPLVRIARGERRTVDLYFRLPDGPIADEELTPFTVAYRVYTPTRRYEASASLARSAHWPTHEDRGPEPGWGRSWWADPAYTWAQYWRRPGHAVPRPPREIEIIHMPRAYFEVMPAVPADVAVQDEWPRTDECNEW
ncbi:MAG: hypothetical protein JO257_36830 [Deltaproteobacteria bacterium]|nr:hypothetical protein [Deltaproteobacteria bacterium]